MQVYPIIKFLSSNLYSDTKKGGLETTHEIITRLKFIGMIKKNEKLDIKSMKVQSNTLWTSLYRFIYQESKDTTLTFLTSTYNRVFELVHVCTLSSKSSDKILCVNIINDLIRSVIGLENLETTYADDLLFICNLQALEELIDIKLKEIKETYPDLIKDKELEMPPEM